MKQAWFILTKRYGGDIRAPSEKQLMDALNEVYVDNNHAKTHADETENGSVTLRFGYDDGLMYVMEIMCDGTITFEEWSDQDAEIELAPPKKMVAVPKAQAQELWTWLAHRQVSKIRNQPWVTID